MLGGKGGQMVGGGDYRKFELRSANRVGRLGALQLEL